MEGFAGIIAETGDCAAAFLVDGKGFQDIVHFGGFEVEAGGFAGAEFAGALEVADAVFVEHHLRDWQIGGQSGG